jgi:hypothetical protein
VSRFLPLLLALLLTGCYSDQKQELASCELEVKRSPPQHYDSVAVQDQVESEYLELCMRAKGYEFSEEYCPFEWSQAALLKRTGNETNLELGTKIVAIEQMQKSTVSCYRPMGWVGQKILDVEQRLGITGNSN